jgi:hypothetical protein
MRFVGAPEGREITIFGEEIFEAFVDDFIGRRLDEGGILIDLAENGLVQPNAGEDLSGLIDFD